jgi:hypothetical protein
VFKGVGRDQVEKVVDQFSEFHKRVIAQTTAFKDLSERINLTIEQYQALRLAGIEAGVSQEHAADRRWSSSTRRSARPSRAAASDRVLSSSASRSSTPTARCARPTTCCARRRRLLLRMQDGAIKTRLETELFGHAGDSLNPMLKTLSGGVETLTEKYRAAGQILDKETIEGLKRSTSRQSRARPASRPCGRPSRRRSRPAWSPRCRASSPTSATRSRPRTTTGTTC